jgi:hypothetical protein
LFQEVIWISVEPLEDSRQPPAAVHATLDRGRSLVLHHIESNTKFLQGEQYQTSSMSPKEEEGDRILLVGQPDFERCDNKVITSKYSLLSFLPVVRGEFVFIHSDPLPQLAIPRLACRIYR